MHISDEILSPMALVIISSLRLSIKLASHDMSTKFILELTPESVLDEILEVQCSCQPSSLMAEFNSPWTVTSSGCDWDPLNGSPWYPMANRKLSAGVSADALNPRLDIPSPR